jgi:hypothetical protein
MLRIQTLFPLGVAAAVAGSHDPRADVGFVHFSNGIHGIGSLDAPTYDWGAYAARIEVRRL